MRYRNTHARPGKIKISGEMKIRKIFLFLQFVLCVLVSASNAPQERPIGLALKPKQPKQPENVHNYESSSRDLHYVANCHRLVKGVLDYSVYVVPSIDSAKLFAPIKETCKRVFALPLRRPSWTAMTLATGALLWCQKDYSLSTIRMCRTLVTVVHICCDYHHVLSTPMRSQGDMRECHVRSSSRLKRLLTKQGGLYIKLGQHLAAMDRALPAPYIEKLSELQDKAKPMTLEEVNHVFQREFGKSLEDVFSEISHDPIGVASIGQVHVGVLKETGRQVAVKVQHMNVDNESNVDLKTLKHAAEIIEFFFPYIQTAPFVRQIERGIRDELDFHKEATNAECAKRFLSQSKVASQTHVPEVYHSLSTKRVLTMEFCPGIKVDDRAALMDAGLDPYMVDSLMYTVFCELIFNLNQVHCDPHPGNLLVSPEGKLVILDHGLYHSVSPGTVKCLSDLWLIVLDGNEKQLRAFAARNGINEAVAEFLISSLSVIRRNVRLGIPITETIKYLQANPPDAVTQKLISEAVNALPPDILHVIKTYELLAANERRLLPNLPAKQKPSLWVISQYARTHAHEADLFTKFRYQLMLTATYLFSYF